ncbi:MAG: cation transporter, partial [Methylobacteriaceae bacterium]|nr:cation transporter [Methylobacteriaceae bacterium]
MKSDINTETVRIGGMTCTACRDKIERKLRGMAGVLHADVDYAAETAAVSWDSSIVSRADIVAAIRQLDYQVLSGTPKTGVYRLTGLLIIIVALYTFLEWTGLLNTLAPERLAETGMSYGMLFVIGLVTSVHCVAMCGGINLSQCLPRKPGATTPNRSAFLLPALYY